MELAIVTLLPYLPSRDQDALLEAGSTITRLDLRIEAILWMLKAVNVRHRSDLDRRFCSDGLSEAEAKLVATLPKVMQPRLYRQIINDWAADVAFNATVMMTSLIKSEQSMKQERPPVITLVLDDD